MTQDSGRSACRAPRFSISDTADPGEAAAGYRGSSLKSIQNCFISAIRSFRASYETPPWMVSNVRVDSLPTGGPISTRRKRAHGGREPPTRLTPVDLPSACSRRPRAPRVLGAVVSVHRWTSGATPRSAQEARAACVPPSIRLRLLRPFYRHAQGPEMNVSDSRRAEVERHRPVVAAPTTVPRDSASAAPPVRARPRPGSPGRCRAGNWWAAPTRRRRRRVRRPGSR